jgi:hypothetical protein
MNASTRITLIITFAVVVLLILLFGSMMITGTMSNGWMMGSYRMVGFGWMWIPAVLSLVLLIVIGWVIHSKNVKKI